MSKTFVNLLAAAMLTLMLGLAFFSLVGDSAVMDEVSHLPAGYSYITQADMRINPEHPPLVKDLAGGAVWLWSKIFSQTINFPSQLPAWQKDINPQWEFGFDFMYKEGNNADLMLLLGRLPSLLILLILGFYVFKWGRELFGQKAALLALFFFAFSPTFLAHGRYVTTDVAATAGIFIASYYFVRWLKAPSAKNLLTAGLVFGLAQLTKFSVFLLVPLFIFVSFIWVCLKLWQEKEKARRLDLLVGKITFQYLGGTALLMALGYILVVWPVYLYHVANYPVAKQQRDIQAILAGFKPHLLADFIYWLAGLPWLRALAQYGLGLAMVMRRAAGGNTIYFLGEVSNVGSRLYFPFIYLVKETLALHILTAMALLLAGWRCLKRKIALGSTSLPALRQNFLQAKNSRCQLGDILNENIDAFLMLSFIVLYWSTSIRSPLNIGVRHILPTFPFIFLLVASQIALWLKMSFKLPSASSSMAGLFHILKQSRDWLLKYCLAGWLIIWQAGSALTVYPSFLAYFNELAGGPSGGWRYAADSNLDWGQDLKRLVRWTDENNISKIYVDYFGGGLAPYYLGEKYLPWWGSRSPRDLNEQGGWLAVSATFLQSGRGQPAPGFNQPTDFYRWLDKFQPTAVIGYSIFIYRIPPHSFE